MAPPFNTGKAPGNPRHVGHVFSLGSAPNATGHAQNILLSVFN